MRQERTVQASIFDLFAEHEIGRELKAMSQWLDEHFDLLELVAGDLRQHGVKETGREGLPAEAVLRCALLKQYCQLSYQELAFYLEDSSSFRAFARLPWGWSPKKSVLHKTISAIRAQTYEVINQALLCTARKEKVEAGNVIRVDSTVTAALIHEPSDSSLLWDAMRVIVDLLLAGSGLGSATPWHDHRCAAKRRAHAIRYTRGRAKRIKNYRELLKVVHATLGYLQAMQEGLPLTAGAAAIAWHAQVRHYKPLIHKVIAQTERRVLAGEQVPASDKLVSLFEPHTDIIVKGRRDVQYGHKINLTTGRTGMVLDLVVEAGNPADSARLMPMLERHIALYGEAPRQAVADGGYASRDNLKAAKACGVHDMAFHKKCGIKIEDMVKSNWTYRKLRNFRAGIEAGISCLKRAYGLGRCTWRGLDHFKAYVWSSVLAYNLALFGRLRTT